MAKIYSLTGFAEGRTENFKFTIKSYNNRFLDINFQIPDFFQNLEQKLKVKIQEKIKRGKIYVKAEMSSFQIPYKFQINKELLREFISVFKEIHPEMQYFPFTLLQKESFILWEYEPDIKIIEEFEKGFDLTLQNFLKSRQEEGEKLKDIILNISRELKANLKEIKEKLENQKETLYEDYKKNLKMLFEDLNFSEDRIAQEAAFLAMKMDAREEIERALQFNERIIEKFERAEGLQGKEIDFLTQEILRELQTLSQKIKDINLREIALNCKILNEQIREQVQNLE
ncbi:MAG: DUF1732 domain-containing protein [Thermoanaerobaculia bacterium]